MKILVALTRGADAAEERELDRAILPAAKRRKNL